MYLQMLIARLGEQIIDSDKTVFDIRQLFVCDSTDVAATLLRVVSPGGRPTGLDGEGESNGRLETRTPCLDQLENVRAES